MGSNPCGGGQTIMNRDEGVNNLSHVNDPALNIWESISPQFLDLDVTANYPFVLCLDHNNISPTEAGCLNSETINKNSKLSIGFDK